jgi:hypothetical protein
MDGTIRTICRILAACILGLFLVQGAMAAPTQSDSRTADRTLRLELKALHQKEKAAKSPEERSAIRAQMREKRHQALETKRVQDAQHATGQGGK